MASFEFCSGYDKAVLKKSQYEGLKAAIRIFPGGAIASSIYAVVVFLLFGSHYEDKLMLAGIIGTLGTTLFSLPVVIFDLRRGCPDTPFLHARYIAFNAVLSLFVSLCLTETVRNTQGNALVFAGIMMFALMAAGAVALSTYTPAQVAWIIFIAMGAGAFVVSRAGDMALPLLVLLLLYTAILFYFSVRISKMIYARIAAQDETERQSQVIALLLNDFEEKANDWLIELDAEGRMSHVSRNFAAAVGRPVEELTGMRLLDLMNSLQARQKSGMYEENYQRRRRERKPVSDILNEVIVGGERRWWLSSGRPVFNAQGECTGWRFIGRDVTEQKMREETIEWQATHDTFTGLYNRHHFLKLVEETVRRQGSASYALVILDLVNFKAIRTIRGQEVGDFVIREMADRLKSALQCEALTARMSGSEFAMLINRGDSRYKKTRSRIISTITQPICAPGGDVAVDVCAGLAVFGKDASDTETLLQYADLALTSAKEAGAGVMQRYSRSLTEQYLIRLVLIGDMDRALQNNEFHLRYQPLVSAATGEVESAEALIRWVHPQKGIIPPGDFIPLAEQSGKITAIGSWVLRQACTDAAQWAKPWRVSVNVSAEQFTHTDLLKEVKSALALSGLPAGRLTLEVTESVLIRNPAHILSILQGLHELGVSISLDDFGSGFSSLSYLQTMPLHELKIDRSFVQTINTEEDPIPVVDTIIVLAKKLGLKTVAEGVETRLQAEVLKRHGCDTFQGFLFSRPTVQSDILRLQLGE
jgi:diguanylate cyclase (GGDEF)-like protein/PAS domain S-box-containing protein